MLDRQENQRPVRKTLRPSAAVLVTFLTKLAKHLVIIACLMIVGRSTGRFAATQFTIFTTILGAALLHTIGRIFQRRLLSPFRQRLEP